MRFLSATLLLLFTFDATLKAQVVKPKKVDEVSVINPRAEIVSSSERIVKGAPFSAEATSESVQMLFDGNRITQSIKTRLYRDSEGRFRRDEMPKPVGIGSFVDMPLMTFILDPVLSVKFYLYPETKTFRPSEFKNEKAFRLKQSEKLEWDINKAKREIAEDEQEITRDEQEIAEAEGEIAEAEEEIAETKQEYEKARLEFEKLKRQPGYRETGKEEQEIRKLKLQIEEQKQEIEARKQQLEAQKQQLKQRKSLLGSRKQETEKPQTPGEKQVTKQAQSESSKESGSSSSSSVTENEKPAKEATKSKAAKTETKPEPAKNSANPIKPNNPSLPVLPKGEVKTESLGTRNIEGVEAEGLRQTTTVAAGAIGNERPIEIVYERWYSKELEITVFSKYTDPRFGEQTYRLTNIKRAEPDAELFKVPADYTVVKKLPDKSRPKPIENDVKKVKSIEKRNLINARMPRKVQIAEPMKIPGIRA